MTISPKRARAVQLVGLDIDGTLTDGGIYLGALDTESGMKRLEFKKYDIQDGLGIHFMRMAGIKVVIVTGRSSESVRLRALELGVDDVAQDPDARKLPLWRTMLERHEIKDKRAAYIGDDIPDLSIMRTVGLAVCVANAVPEILKVSHVRLKREGGKGAIREFAEKLLKARGEWDDVIEKYVAERSGADMGTTVEQKA